MEKGGGEGGGDVCGHLLKKGTAYVNVNAMYPIHWQVLLAASDEATTLCSATECQA